MHSTVRWLIFSNSQFGCREGWPTVMTLADWILTNPRSVCQQSKVLFHFFFNFTVRNVCPRVPRVWNHHIFCTQNKYGLRGTFCCSVWFYLQGFIFKVCVSNQFYSRQTGTFFLEAINDLTILIPLLVKMIFFAVDLSWHLQSSSSYRIHRLLQSQ